MLSRWQVQWRLARPWARWPIAVVAFACADVFTRATWPLLHLTPFVAYFGAVVASTWIGGPGPGLVAIALTVAGWILFPLIGDVPWHVPVVAFVLITGAFSWIVHRRLTAEAGRQESQEQLNAILGNVPLVLWMIDARGTVTLLEGQGLKPLGLRPGQLVGRSLKDVYPDVPAVQNAARQALEGEAVQFNVELGGAIFDCWYSPVRGGPDNAVVSAIGVAADVTARVRARRLEEHIAQRQRLESIGQLAGGVAHDFNNLLTVINGYCDVLRDEPSLDEDARASLEEIRRAGRRAAALTRQLLTFARRQVLVPRVFDLNVAVANAQQLLRRLIGEHITLRIALAPRVVPVCIDPAQLEQVVTNLAVNARDAMPHGGTLTLETDVVEVEQAEYPPMPAGRYVRLRVRDTGIGMAPEVSARVFEPFFTTKEQGKGTGLGLSTVYGIVKQSGGYIWVSSAPNEGTTFGIYFAPAAGPLESIDDDGPRALQTELRGDETVLVVEDEAAVRVVTCDILRRAGYRVLEAESGDAALPIAAVPDRSIDLLLTDLVMPGLPGRELARRLTALRPGLKVLFMTGYADDGGLLQERNGGPVLDKPFTQADLLGHVREILDRL